MDLDLKSGGYSTHAGRTLARQKAGTRRMWVVWGLCSFDVLGTSSWPQERDVEAEGSSTTSRHQGCKLFASPRSSVLTELLQAPLPSLTKTWLSNSNSGRASLTRFVKFDFETRSDLLQDLLCFLCVCRKVLFYSCFQNTRSTAMPPRLTHVSHDPDGCQRSGNDVRGERCGCVRWFVQVCLSWTAALQRRNRTN